VLLRYYSSVIGNLKYWIIISLPLIIFIGAIYLTILSLSTGSFTFCDQDLIAFRAHFRFAETVGGIFVFSFALLSISNSMKKGKEDNKALKPVVSITADYMSVRRCNACSYSTGIYNPVILSSVWS
jgi:hypothetical protein